VQELVQANGYPAGQPGGARGTAEQGPAGAQAGDQGQGEQR
jgi:hypothetical protein